MSAHTVFLVAKSVSIVGNLLGGIGVVVHVTDGKPLGFVLSATAAAHLKAALPGAKP